MIQNADYKLDEIKELVAITPRSNLHRWVLFRIEIWISLIWIRFGFLDSPQMTRVNRTLFVVI